MNNLVRPVVLPEQCGLNVPLAESPETAVARTHPYEVLRFLDRESQRRCDAASLSVGGGIAQAYLQRLSPEETSKISDIGIKLVSERTFLGFILSDRGLLVSFYRG